MKRSRICLALFLLSLCAPAFGDPGVEMSVWTNCSQVALAHDGRCKAKQFPPLTCSQSVAGVDLNEGAVCTVRVDDDGPVRKVKGMWELIVTVGFFPPGEVGSDEVDIVLPLPGWKTNRRGDAVGVLPGESVIRAAISEARLDEFDPVINHLTVVAKPTNRKKAQAYGLFCEAHGPPLK